MQDVQRHLGRRVSLNSIAEATLGKGKSGNGKEAILSLGEIAAWILLRKYCLDDVRIAKRCIGLWSCPNGKILYKDFFEIKEIPVKWTDPEPRVAMQKQISLF